MCDEDDPVGISNVSIGEVPGHDHTHPHDAHTGHSHDHPGSSAVKQEKSQPTLEEFANHLAETHQEFIFGRHQNGFVAYGDVSPGDKVLIAASNLHEPEVTEAIIAALKRKGASIVDVMILDDGPG